MREKQSPTKQIYEVDKNPKGIHFPLIHVLNKYIIHVSFYRRTLTECT